MSELPKPSPPSRPDLYDGAECYGCGEQAVVTDVNGLDLCQACADGCRIPEFDA